MFRLLDVIDTNSPIYQLPMNISKSMDLFLCNIWEKGRVEVEASIPRKAFAKGERIPLRLQFKHEGSFKIIQRVETYFLKTTKYRRINTKQL